MKSQRYVCPVWVREITIPLWVIAALNAEGVFQLLFALSALSAFGIVVIHSWKAVFVK